MSLITKVSLQYFQARDRMEKKIKRKSRERINLNQTSDNRQIWHVLKRKREELNGMQGNNCACRSLLHDKYAHTSYIKSMERTETGEQMCMYINTYMDAIPTEIGSDPATQNWLENRILINSLSKELAEV